MYLVRSMGIGSLDSVVVLLSFSTSRYCSSSGDSLIRSLGVDAAELCSGDVAVLVVSAGSSGMDICMAGSSCGGLGH